MITDLIGLHSVLLPLFILHFGKRKIIRLAEFLDQAMPCAVPVLDFIISEHSQYQLAFCRDFHILIVLARLLLIYVIMYKENGFIALQFFNFYFYFILRLDCL